MFPSTVRFPISSAAGVSVALETLIGTATHMELYLQNGDAFAARTLLDAIHLPRELHAAAVGDIAVGLGLSQTRIFDEAKMRALMKQMTSDFYLRGIHSAKPGWEPLVAGVPAYYTGQWIGDRPDGGARPFVVSKEENQQLRRGLHNELIGRVARLREDHQILQGMLPSESDTNARARMEAAIDAGRYNAQALLALAMPLGSGGLRVHHHWGDAKRDGIVHEKGRRGELMSQQDYADTLRDAMRKREALNAENSLTIGAPLQTVSLGRTAGNDLVIPNPMISGQHAFLHVVDTPRGRRIAIEDRGSMNGLFVRGERLKPGRKVLLQHGETFYVGSVSVKTMISPDVFAGGMSLKLIQNPDSSTLVVSPDFL